MKKSTIKLLLGVFIIALIISIGPLCSFLNSDASLISLNASAVSNYLNKKSVTLTVGCTTTLKLLNNNNAGISYKKIKWNSKNKDVVSINSKGNIVAVNSGNTYVTAAYNGKTYRCKVVVKNATFKYNKKTITTGGSFTQVLFNASNNKIDNEQIKWKSDNIKIATVSSKGKVTAVKAGTAKIYATYKGKKYTSTLVIKDATLKYGEKTLYVDEKITQVLYSANGEKIDPSKVEWKTSNKGVVTVNSKGVIKGKSCGSAKIYATYLGKKYETILIVKSNISIQKTSFNLKANQEFNIRMKTTDYISYISYKIVEGEDIVNCSWSEWDGNDIFLKIDTLSSGNCKIKIFNSDNENDCINLTIVVTSIDSEIQDSNPVHIHSFYKDVVLPNCTTSGYICYTCECGYVYKDDVLSALGHVEAIDKAVEATEFNTGLTEGKHCSVCGIVLVPQTVIPKKIHTHSYTTATINPTCLQQGYTLFECECGYSYKGNYTNQLGHTEVIDSAVSATATSTGLTEGKHCSVCGLILVAQKVTPKDKSSLVDNTTFLLNNNLSEEYSYISSLKVYTKCKIDSVEHKVTTNSYNDNINLNITFLMKKTYQGNFNVDNIKFHYTLYCDGIAVKTGDVIVTHADFGALYEKTISYSGKPGNYTMTCKSVMY